MPSALIKVNQGAGTYTDVPGRAVIGAIGGGTVVFSNGDDTGVVNWLYEVLYVPPSSAIPLTVQDGGTPTFTMATPDRRGCYRVRLTTTDAAGNTDTDIRNFGVPFPNLGFIAPPYQANPDPLPLTGPGSKPDELNFAGDTHGWDGTTAPEPYTKTMHRMMYSLMQDLSESGFHQAAGATTDNTANVVIETVFGAALENGTYFVEAQFIANGVVDDAVLSKVALFTVSGGVIAQIGATGSNFATIASGGAGGWAANLRTVGNNIEMVVTGALATNITWTVCYNLRRGA